MVPGSAALLLFSCNIRIGEAIVGGDVVNNNGSGKFMKYRAIRLFELGGASIYGNTFNDENFELSHDKEGMLSMVTLFS